VIESYVIKLPSGIELSCRAAGRRDRPLLLFLHGFPEAAFVWDDMLERFAADFHCVAPNLRGFERSSAPVEVEAYRAKHLVADVAGLIDVLGGSAHALVAHDWGGAVAWAFAALHPDAVKRLVIINSPHPATFLRELRTNPLQQSASAYMHFLCRSDAEALLAADDYRRLWTLLTSMGATDPARPGGGWLTESLRESYRSAWDCGLTGGCNYYRASPLRPPRAPDDPVMAISLPPETLTVRVPTLVIWGEQDLALRVQLLDGLEAFVPDLRIIRVPDATHWIVHERPALVADEIRKALAS
jgi:pimeloyl-ACP methyl ester carboxylesterase